MSETTEEGFVLSQDLLTCPNCQSRNDPDAIFCDACGKKVRAVIVCAWCKTENDQEAKFCDQCGKPLDTPEYQAKQSLRLKIGLVVLGFFWLILVIVAISDVKKGKWDFAYSPKRDMQEFKKK